MGHFRNQPKPNSWYEGGYKDKNSDIIIITKVEAVFLSMDLTETWEAEEMGFDI